MGTPWLGRGLAPGWSGARGRGSRPRRARRARARPGGTKRSRPRLAIWLNVSPAHLARHPTLDDYVAAKARIFANQTAEDWAVVNADDPVVLAEARRSRGRVLPFRPGGEGVPSGGGA